MTKPIIMARICFALDANAGLGIQVLRAHGYEVLTHIFPSEPDHLFVEASRATTYSDVEELDKVCGLVEPFGGFVSDCGRPPFDHQPFDYEGEAWTRPLH
jgi:hypothetical protein